MSCYCRQRSLWTKATRRRNILAATVLLFMLAAHILSAAHFLLIPHSIHCHTGKMLGPMIHHEHEERHKGVGHDPGDDHSSSKEGECPICALFHQARIPVNTTSTAVFAASISDELIVPRIVETAADVHRRIYLVSPSHSPPYPLVFIS